MNLTITIDDETLRRARMRARSENTSVNAVVRDFLEDYADRKTAAREATDRILATARRSTAGSGTQGRTWTREDLYERPILRR
jgi:predicted transcriptional regulator